LELSPFYDVRKSVKGGGAIKDLNVLIELVVTSNDKPNWNQSKRRLSKRKSCVFLTLHVVPIFDILKNNNLFNPNTCLFGKRTMVRMCSVYTGFAVYSKTALTLDSVYTGFVAYSKKTTTLDLVYTVFAVYSRQRLPWNWSMQVSLYIPSQRPPWIRSIQDLMYILRQLTPWIQSMQDSLYIPRQRPPWIRSIQY
jgi:hypothetical protein